MSFNRRWHKLAPFVRPKNGVEPIFPSPHPTRQTWQGVVYTDGQNAPSLGGERGTRLYQAKKWRKLVISPGFINHPESICIQPRFTFFFAF